MRNYRELENYVYGNNSLKSDSCSLALLKLVNVSVIENKENKSVTENTKSKKDFLKLFSTLPKLPVKFDERVNRQVEGLKRQGYGVVFNRNLKTSSRLIVGLGATHVLETSITLHHIFGVPYIPGSALKGVVRSISFWDVVEKSEESKSMEEKELQKLQESLYEEEISDDDNEEEIKHKLLFGTQGFKGLLVFLDAYPVVSEGEKIFELDVMNPHYSEYYSNPKNIPGDWESPKPIFFLTVKRGINFHFSVLIDEFRIRKIMSCEGFSENIRSVLKKWYKDNYQELTKEVQSWITRALEEFGVGSKTRLGYGIFE